MSDDQAAASDGKKTFVKARLKEKVLRKMDDRREKSDFSADFKQQMVAFENYHKALMDILEGLKRSVQTDSNKRDKKSNILVHAKNCYTEHTVALLALKDGQKESKEPKEPKEEGAPTEKKQKTETPISRLIGLYHQVDTRYKSHQYKLGELLKKLYNFDQEFDAYKKQIKELNNRTLEMDHYTNEVRKHCPQFNEPKTSADDDGSTESSEEERVRPSPSELEANTVLQKQMAAWTRCNNATQAQTEVCLKLVAVLPKRQEEHRKVLAEWFEELAQFYMHVAKWEKQASEDYNRILERTAPAAEQTPNP